VRFVLSILVALNSDCVRAPELWFPSNGIVETKYTNKVDVYSMGLVFLQLWFDISNKTLVENYLAKIGMESTFVCVIVWVG
jgi:hypothetical protein